MNDYGHIKISRKAYAPQEVGGDPFWNEPRVFSRWEAWEYMIQSAAWADHQRIVSGDVVQIARGHTPPLALSYLAEAWGWSTKRVRNFIKLLDEMDRIRAVGGARSGTVYLILNYDHYQSQGQAKGHAKGNGGGTLGARSGQELEAGKAIKQGEDMSGSAEPNRDRQQITEVFNYWRSRCGHEKATLTKERRSKIRARLRLFTPDQLKQAVDVVAEDPFYQGDNDRGQRYDFPETFLKNDSAVDRLISKVRKNGNRTGERVRVLKPGEVFQ